MQSYIGLFFLSTLPLVSDSGTGQMLVNVYIKAETAKLGRDIDILDYG